MLSQLPQQAFSPPTASSDAGMSQRYTRLPEGAVGWHASAAVGRGPAAVYVEAQQRDGLLFVHDSWHAKLPTRDGGGEDRYMKQGARKHRGDAALIDWVPSPR